MIKPKHNRKGSIYITVLGVSSLVMVLGISSVISNRIQVRENIMIQQGSNAKSNAESGLAFGLNLIKTNTQWRTDFNTADGRLGPYTMPNNQGTFELVAIDTSDGNLINNITDPVTLYATGRDGNGAYHLAVDIESKETGIPPLAGNIYAASNLQVSSGTFTAEKNLFVGGDVNSLITPIVADIDYGSTYTITAMTGSLRALDPDFNANQLPNIAALITEYKALGEVIRYQKIPYTSGKRTLSNLTISTTSTPFGGWKSPKGVYYINCRNEELIIENCTIDATLVLDNATGITIKGNTTWKGPSSNFPAVIAESSGAMIIENNTGTTSIQGIIYSNSDVQFKGTDVSIQGTIITPLNVYSDANTNVVMTYTSDAFDTPAPGFAAPSRMMIIDDTYKQVASVPGQTQIPVTPQRSSGASPPENARSGVPANTSTTETTPSKGKSGK